MRRTSVLITCIILMALSGCAGGAGASPAPTPTAARSAGPEPSRTGDLACIPEAKRLDMPLITETGFDIYGTAWIDGNLLLVMAQKENDEGWDYRLYACNTDTGEVFPFDDGIGNFGWFGRRLTDGRLCMYDYNRILLLNTGDFSCESVLEFPPSESIAELDVSPDGSRIAFTDMENGDLYVSGTDFSDIRCIVKAEKDTEETGMGRPSTPVWSQDGRRIFYEIYRGEKVAICAVDADGKNNRVLAEVPECSFHLLNDGRFLLLSFQGELKSFDPASGETKQLLPGKEYLPIAWDEGGRFAAAVLIGGNGGNDRMLLFDLSAGKEIKRWDMPQYAPIYFDFDSFSPDGSKFSFLYADEEGQNACYILNLNEFDGGPDAGNQ